MIDKEHFVERAIFINVKHLNNFRMKKIANVSLIVLVAILGGLTAIFAYNKIVGTPKYVAVSEQPVRYASLPSSQTQMPDLTYAAENSVKGVVHIKTQYTSKGYSGGGSLFDYLFGDRGFYYPSEPQIQQASGSGVVISTDGYIVTNNHVIENSDEINVVLSDNREFKAKLVGTDPSTDIALLKIDADQLYMIPWGNSDDLKLGEWVLAVGNPFNLTSTVTAGIVSAKSRSINIIGGQMPIESFIQTDAAVNPGNSGGALVNTRGELMGINTAIASKTGSYTGYSFAVPSSIAKKVVSDLKEYGEVQRALLGVSIKTMSSDLAKEKKIDFVEGVYVDDVVADGAAQAAGIKAGDIIVSFNGASTKTSSELQEHVSQMRPGDSVKIIVKRGGKEKLFELTLRNTRGDTGVVRDNMSVLGAELANVDEETLEKLNLRNGLKVQKLMSGKLKTAGVKEGFIITSVNKRPVSSINEVKELLKSSRGGVLVEGVYPNGQEAYYVFGQDRPDRIHD